MRRSPLGVVVLVAACVSAALPSAAQAQAPRTDFKLTLVARECPAYTDITANRARNDIQESLKDLGADTPYKQGQAMDPAVEAAAQPNCRPITGWDFTTGTGYRTRAVTGPWGALSIVTGAYPGTPRTLASTPLLNSSGQPTGRAIEGAVTFSLTAAQADQASRPNRFWVQGGTPADPILDQRFPGVYGFGALRCAIDNLNGDNVEWVGYPTGSTHVFCFAYYVKPPPTSGTIVIRKEVDAPAGTPSETFRFKGNISYNTDETFTVGAGPGQPGSATFYRAAGDTWDVTEQAQPGYVLTGLTCSSRNGTSQTTTALDTGRADILLGAGDLVTCTYTNRYTPPVAALLLRKITLDGTGEFSFDVARLGGGGSRRVSVETTQPGVPVAADPLEDLEPGDYQLTEGVPQNQGGRWTLQSLVCGTTLVEPVQPATITLEGGASQVCTFTNRFIADGALRLRKSTAGGTGRFGFLIQPLARIAEQYLQSATTTREETPVIATGDDTSRLRLGRYLVTETVPPSPAGREWTQDSVVCDGRPVGASGGRFLVTLTRQNPRLDCTIHNRLSAEEPGGGGDGGTPDPPNPDPDPGGGGEVEGGGEVAPEADLRVVKTVSRPSVRVGGTVVYTVRVTNRGPAAAEDVVLTETEAAGREIVRWSGPNGVRCRTQPRPRCDLGTMPAGRTVTVRVVVRPSRTGTFVNTAAATSSTYDPDPAAARDSARLRVLAARQPAPAITG